MRLEAPADRRVRYREFAGVGGPKRVKVHRFAESGPGTRKVVYGNNLDEMRGAIMGRVFYVKRDGQFVRPLQPERNAWRLLMRRVRTKIVKTTPPVRKLSISQFLARYKGPKLRSYEQAAETLPFVPLSDSDFEIGAFIKKEKQELNKCPRVIRPVSVRANLELGMYVYPLEKAIYNTINNLCADDGCTWVTVTKGLNTFELGEVVAEKWAMFTDPVTVNLDCERFDQHVSVPALQWARSVLVGCIHNDGDGDDQKILQWLLDKQNRTKLKAKCHDGRIYSEFDGTLNSGVMNTSLYGVLLMFSMVWALVKEMRIKYEILCAGDDTNVIMERSDAARFEERVQRWGARFGFSIKIESVTDQLEQMVFCRMRPVFDGKRWRMVRDVVDALCRDSTTIKPIASQKAYDTMRHSISQCGLSICPGMPVMQSFYQMLGRGVGNSKVDQDKSMSGMKYMALGLDPKIEPITDEARLSFWKAFGFTPTEQVTLESAYDRLAPSYATRCDSSFDSVFPQNRIDYGA